MKSSSVYKPTIEPTINQQWDLLYPNARNYSRPKESHALRILAAVSAFIKLIESLFWLSLLLEVTHNEVRNTCFLNLIHNSMMLFEDYKLYQIIL